MSTGTVLNRFLEDRFGLISVLYIVVITFIAAFAYVLAPDSSPNANQMHLSIHSKPPGFSTQILILPNSNFEKGTEEIAIEQLVWKEDKLFFQAFGTSQDYLQLVNLNLYPTQTTYKQVEELFVTKKTFLLGTDKYGRDLLSRVLIGSRISISIGFVAVIISLLVGVFIGALAGYFGGKLDRFMVWFINVVWSIPTLLMVIGITLALGKGYWQVFIAVGLTMWVEVARVVRGQVISVKEKTFIQAARVLGYSDYRILVKHILPIIIPPLIVISAANFASAILIESGLSFLGIGAQPPVPSWGGMIKDHFRYILLGKPYLAIVPGIAIMSLVFAFMTLGNSLRDALDVKL
ncbi:MAG: ABC transporter permease [Flavobacteriaceae bacterium]|nr:ABC transporter permease [Flavobacteriaceae bacterium]